mgnify:CR=1 FL=1
MKPHETRLKSELEDLQGKIDGLEVFIRLNPAMDELSEEAIKLVLEQFDLMRLYAAVLEQRLKMANE